VRALLWRAALFALLWWAFTDGRHGSWMVGGVSVAVATAFSLRLLPPVTTYVRASACCASCCSSSRSRCTAASRSRGSRCARAWGCSPTFTKSHCVFLILVGLGQRDGAVDPVPQAMVLAGIVVAIAATALALARQLLELSGRMQLPEDRSDTSQADQ